MNRQHPSEVGTVIAGAGPAGLTAAWELTRLGRPAVVFEKDEVVGGLARTVEYRGYRFDIGGHRFFTKVPLVRRIWRELLEDELLERPRLSRIYYKGVFFDYPLRPLRALLGLGPVESVRVAASYIAAQVAPHPEERNFEQWVSNRFGRRLYEIFFKTYTEKVWGMPCSDIDAAWAAQRIKNLNLATALKSALLPRRRGPVVTSLIDRFLYPRLGPGQMWERCRDLLAERGVDTVLGTRIAAVHHYGEQVRTVTVETHEGRREEVPAGGLVSTMPLPELVRILDPAPPEPVLDAASRLRFRDFLTVALIVDREEVFPDNWIYIHAPEVKVGRVQNFKNWSPHMVAEPGRTALGLEYFLQEGDDLWTAPDSQLIALATREMAELGLVRSEEVIDGTVVRMPKAYPVYDRGYRDAVAEIRAYLDELTNLYPVGRNGQHRYNNQDHSMLAGVYAARNIAGASYDLWSVNVDEEYHEEASYEETAEPALRPRAGADRLVPERLEAAPSGRSPRLEPALREAFARYQPEALGAAIGAVGAATVFVATALPVLQGNDALAPNLSLLGNYLIGYSMSWSGALIGATEAALGGFLFGNLLGRAINLLVGWSERALRRRLELIRSFDPLSGDRS